MNNTVKDKRTLYRHNNLSFPEIASFRHKDLFNKYFFKQMLY